MELIDQLTEQISTMFLILISFAFPSHLSDGQILIKLLAKNADQNKVICFNDDSETAYIDYVYCSASSTYLCQLEKIFWKTGKTLTDCEEPAVVSEGLTWLYWLASQI